MQKLRRRLQALGKSPMPPSPKSSCLSFLGPLFQYQNHQSEKSRIFNKQTLQNDFTLIKRPLILLFLLFTLSDLIQSLSIIHSLSPNTNVGGNFIQIGLFCAGCIVYYLATLQNTRILPYKIIRHKYWFFLIANLLFGSSEALNTYKRLSAAVTINTTDQWLAQTNWSSDVMYLIIFSDLGNPMWFFKLIFPCSTLIPAFVVSYEYNISQKTTLYLRSFSVVIYLCLLFILKDLVDMRIMSDRYSSINEIQNYQDVFKQVNSPVFIINKSGSTVYLNQELEKLCKGDLDWFYINLVHLVKFKHPDTRIESIWTINNRDMATDRGDLEIHIPEKVREEDELSDLEESFGNLAELLDKMKSHLKNNTLKHEEPLYYKGKALYEDEGISHLSYILKIFPTQDLEKIVVVVIDISKQESIEYLEAVNVYKDKLLATVSHDMKAPLNGSLALIESARDDDTVPKQVKEQYLMPAYESCRFLLHLINDILDFAQIKAQKLRMYFEEGSLIKTVKSCFQLMEIQALKKGLNFAVEIDNNIPEQFATDHHRVSQIILNLLSNAIKFTFKGKVVMSLKAVSKNIIKIDVTDTGIGIKKDDMSKLFSEFTHIEYDRQGINRQGVGLGLMICNYLALKLGPSEMAGIKVESTYGVGSTFSFLLEQKQVREVKSYTRLTSVKSLLEIKTKLRSNKSRGPIKSSDSKDLPSSIELLGGESQHNINHPYQTLIPSVFKPLMIGSNNIKTDSFKIEEKILIVDDDPFNILALESLLKQLKVSVDVAFNGQSAIQKVHENYKKEANVGNEDNKESLQNKLAALEIDIDPEPSYGLIFMDCKMPIMGGLEASQILTRQMEKGEIGFIPIIGCTGYDARESYEECRESGMTDVISKPVSKKKLKEILAKYFYEGT